MSKKRKKVRVETFEGAIPEKREDTSVNTLKEMRDRFNERRAQQEKEEEYKGPLVEWKHDGATKAAEIKAGVINNENPPAIDEVIIPQDDDPDFEAIEGEVPEGFSRINVPSGCLFYDFKSLFIRPLKPVEAIRITSACEGNDIVALHDVLNATVNENIRELWWTDYIYVLFWHRLNSYVKIPYTIKWQSIYGNVRSDEIRTSNLGYSRLGMTQEQWDKYREMGLRPPSVHDAEMMNSFEFNKDTWAIWLRAQFVKGDTIQDKLSFVENVTDLALLTHIKEFSHLLESKGVQQYIQVCDVDLKDRWDESFQFLKEKIEYFPTLLDENNGLDEWEKKKILEQMDRNVKEFKRLENSKPGEAEPLLETIRIGVNELTFLPRL